MSRLSKAARRRIELELREPYEGIMYEGGRPRNGKYARLRLADLEALLALADRP